MIVVCGAEVELRCAFAPRTAIKLVGV